MLNDFWNKIKSGSDIRGIASGEGIELTNEVIEKICSAFVYWLSNKYNIEYSNITVAIGHDSRISASRIKNVVINKLVSLGVSVYDCSLSSTPAMFMAISVLQCTASIEITASHLSYERNGFKFFTQKGGLSGEDIENVLKSAQDDIDIPYNGCKGKVRAINVMKYYIEKLKDVIIKGINVFDDAPLKGFKIVVDAGNGVGGFFATEVLKPLGADINGSEGLNPNGMFPIHIPNPEDEEAIKYTSKLTVASNADLGIIFDTDVDRASLIDSSGDIISKTKLVALVSKIVLKDNPNSVIVTDSMTHESLRDFIEKSGGIQLRYKRGYNNVITMAKKINSNNGMCPLAIETSGHAAFEENDFIDDGAYLACKLIVAAVNAKNNGQKLTDNIKELAAPAAELDTRFKFDVNTNSFEKMVKELKNQSERNKSIEIDKNNFEGIRLHFSAKQENGWVLIRESLHEPEIILHIESYTVGGIKSILHFIKPILKKNGFVSNDMQL